MRLPRDLGTAVLVAVAVFLAAESSYALSLGGVVSVWFPSGVVLALLLLSERRRWVLVLAGAFLGNVVADVLHVAPRGLWLLAPLANIAEGACAAMTVQWLAGPRNPVVSVRGTGALVLGAATLSNAVTAVLGGGVLHAFYTTGFGYQWLTWWIGDGLGMIVVTPAILGVREWMTRLPLREGRRREVLEAAALSAGVLILVTFTFGRPASLDPFLSALVFPLLILAGLRLRTGAHGIVLLNTVLVLWFSSRGQGPLVHAGLTPIQMAVQVFAFVCIAAVSVLVLSAALAERELGAEEREKLKLQLLQASKMEAIGRLTGGIAHDFNNMLTVITGHAEFAAMQVGDDHPLQEDIRQIRAAAERSANLTQQLLGFARRQPVAPRVVDLNQFVEGMLEMLRRLVGEDVPLVFRPHPETWPTRIDPTQLHQILMNLCANARDAIEGRGTIVVETGNVRFDEEYCREHPGFRPGEFVMLAVTDDGHGMDPETLSHAFEPFFTTKEAQRGTGLGLASVYGILKQNNGFINLYSEPEAGTSVRMYLPALPDSEVVPEPSRSTEPRGASTGTVLLVEDNEAILSLSTLTLRRAGYEVLAADTPSAALELATAHAEPIDLLVTDVVLPGMNGRELAEHVTVRSPGTRVLFTSGYTANVVVQRGIHEENVNFLPKPYAPEELTRKVQAVLSG